MCHLCIMFKARALDTCPPQHERHPGWVDGMSKLVAPRPLHDISDLKNPAVEVIHERSGRIC